MYKLIKKRKIVKRLKQLHKEKERLNNLYKAREYDIGWDISDEYKIRKEIKDALRDMQENDRRQLYYRVTSDLQEELIERDINFYTKKLVENEVGR